MDRAELIRRGSIVVTEWTGERNVGCYLGNGRFGAVMAATGLNLSPEQQKEPGRNDSHFRHISHWGRFNLISPYTQNPTSGDYLLPFFRLYWEKEYRNITEYRQCHDLYDAVLNTRFCTESGERLSVTSWFDAVKRNLAGFLIDANEEAVSGNSICLSVPTSFNPWTFLCRKEYSQSVTVEKNGSGWKLTVFCGDSVNKSKITLYILTDMIVEPTETGLRLRMNSGLNKLLLSVSEPPAEETAEESLSRTKEQTHRTWESIGWIDHSDPQVQQVWVRSMAYLLSSYDADCEYIQPANSMGINGFPYNFVPDIANIAPSLLMLGRGDIVRHWVEKYAGEIEEMRRYARFLWPEADGIFPPWERNFGPYEGHHSPTAPMIFFYEAHNTGYLAKLAMEAAEYSGDEAWARKYAYPLIDECAKFFFRFCHKEADGLWHLKWYPCMGRDEAGGVNKDDYLCTLIAAKYTFKAAIRCGFDPNGDYAAILSDGLAFRSLRSGRGTLHTCRGADDFGRQKHPIQLEGIANFPIEPTASEEELTAYRLRHDITQEAHVPRFYGWTLAQLLMAGTNLKDRESWQHDWDLLQPSHNTDPLWIQFYESSDLSAFYTATHGMVLQSLIRNCVNDFWGCLEIGSCLPDDARVRFGDIRTRFGVTVSGTVENGKLSGTITADRDTTIVFQNKEIPMKCGETMEFLFSSC